MLVKGDPGVHRRSGPFIKHPLNFKPWCITSSAQVLQCRRIKIPHQDNSHQFSVFVCIYSHFYSKIDCEKQHQDHSQWRWVCSCLGLLNVMIISHDSDATRAAWYLKSHATWIKMYDLCHILEIKFSTFATDKYILFPRVLSVFMNLDSFQEYIPDNKIHGTNMGPTWVLSTPGGPHVGPMNHAIRYTTISHFQVSNTASGHPQSEVIAGGYG